jgi:hypothetical protein
MAVATDRLVLVHATLGSGTGVPVASCTTTGSRRLSPTAISRTLSSTRIW